jgi:predicted nucleic acid-binding protein
VESFALIQRRLGIAAVRVFQEDILPLINIEWINAGTHKSAVSALLAASRRKLSLVDCVSFEIMCTLGIKTVFAFDPHFAEQGFKCIP